MGYYFVMSMRFNKSNASDFGLTYVDERVAINPNDKSVWTKVRLYDFGWGKENGFYREPLLGFDALFEIALNSTDSEDSYGAAAIILESFPNDLLHKCEIFMNDGFRKNDFRKMVELFNLKDPINRCSTSEKSYEQIQDDYRRWKVVSDMALKAEHRNCFSHRLH